MGLLDSLQRAREAYDLGRELQAAIERGQRLHPWEGHAKQERALLDEVSELLAEMQTKDIDTARVSAEALDVFVCAERLRQGR